jgi:hypothetical protein
MAFEVSPWLRRKRCPADGRSVRASERVRVCLGERALSSRSSQESSQFTNSLAARSLWGIKPCYIIPFYIPAWCMAVRVCERPWCVRAREPPASLWYKYLQLQYTRYDRRYAMNHEIWPADRRAPSLSPGRLHLHSIPRSLSGFHHSRDLMIRQNNWQINLQTFDDSYISLT